MSRRGSSDRPPSPGRRPGRCSRRAPGRSRPAGRAGPRCRTGPRAGCRWPPPGGSSGTCPCRATARPGAARRGLAKWEAKRTPAAASRSRWGVSTSGWPATDRQSARNWSRVTKRTFTPPTLAAPDRPTTGAGPGRSRPGSRRGGRPGAGRTLRRLAPHGARRRAHRGRRPVRGRGRLPPRDGPPGDDLRHPRGPRRHRRDVGPVPLPRASARTRTCSPSATRSSRGWATRPSPTAPRSSPTSAATAPHHGVEDRMRFHRRRAVGASWSTPDARWTVEVEDTDTGEREQADLRLPVGQHRATTGYDEGYRPEFPGEDELRRPHRPPPALARGPRVAAAGGSS